MSTETSPPAISHRSAVEDIPIAEFDPDRTAVIEPGSGLVVTPRDIPRAAFMCFFNEVVERIAARPEARKVGALHAAHGKHTIWEIAIRGERLAVFHPGVGSPMAAMFMEAAIGLGCGAFCACGGAGALQPDLALGQVIVPDSALRDEGTSFHYLAPDRIVDADRRGVTIAVDVLERLRLPHLVGRTWTTDAPYRETRSKVQHRLDEGCVHRGDGGCGIVRGRPFPWGPLRAVVVCRRQPGRREMGGSRLASR